VHQHLPYLEPLKTLQFLFLGIQRRLVQPSMETLALPLQMLVVTLLLQRRVSLEILVALPQM
jgi:hypothetical protein